MIPSISRIAWSASTTSDVARSGEWPLQELAEGAVGGVGLDYLDEIIQAPADLSSGIDNDPVETLVRRWFHRVSFPIRPSPLMPNGCDVLSPALIVALLVICLPGPVLFRVPLVAFRVFNRIISAINIAQPAVDGDLISQSEFRIIDKTFFLRFHHLEHLAVDDADFAESGRGNRRMRGGPAPCRQESVAVEDHIDIVGDGVGPNEDFFHAGELAVSFLQVIPIENDNAVHCATANADAGAEKLHGVLLRGKDTQLFRLAGSIVPCLEDVQVLLARGLEGELDFLVVESEGFHEKFSTIVQFPVNLGEVLFQGYLQVSRGIHCAVFQKSAGYEPDRKRRPLPG